MFSSWFLEIAICSWTFVKSHHVRPHEHARRVCCVVRAQYWSETFRVMRKSQCCTSKSCSELLYLSKPFAKVIHKKGISCIYAQTGPKVKVDRIRNEAMGGSISIIKWTALVVIRVLLVLFPRSFWDFHWVWNCISSWSLLSLRSSPSLSNDIIRRKVAPRELLGQAFWSTDLHGSQSSSVLTMRFLRWSPR